jgi:uridine kinase
MEQAHPPVIASAGMSGPVVISAEAAIAEVETRLADARVIAIDGAPLSGKSTLAQQLADRLGLEQLGLDDFYDGPQHGPGYPYRYFRYAEFEDALHAFRRDGACAYRRWDWPRMAKAVDLTRVAPQRTPLIVEGCSVLQRRFLPLYDLTLFVESERATRRQAQLLRDGGRMAGVWNDVVWPSVALWEATDPAAMAQVRVAGRGCASGAPGS